MKGKKNLKGMTLVEIIVAMAVFAMLGVILLGIGQVIDSTTKASSRLSKKITAQAPVAASKSKNYTVDEDLDGDGYKDSKELYSEDMNIKVSIDDGSGNPKQVKITYENAAGDVVSEIFSAEEDINTKKYSTKELVEDNKLIYDPDGPNANLNFQFVEIQPATEPTT